MARSIYLAGPDVFLPHAKEIGERKCRLCERYGFTGLFPLDPVARPHAGQTQSAAIYDANLAMVADADLLIANLTPFRGPSADPGTVFELAYAHALGKPVFAYSNVPGTIAERVAALPGLGPLTRGADGRPYGADGLAVEDFGLADNLMIVEALHRAGTRVVMPSQTVADPVRDLSTFELCVAEAASAFACSEGEQARHKPAA